MLGNAPSIAQKYSQTVRVMTMVFVATTVFGTAILYIFSTMMFGLSKNTSDITVSTSDCGGVNVSCSTMAGELLSRAVAEERAAGLSCSTKPALTDVVLFQYAADQSVSVLTFDGALTASRHRLGWVQRYCR